MTQESFTPRVPRHEWETPVIEEIGVSAEVTAYMYTWEDQD